VLSTPLPWLASELGWISAEVGRQPWLVQGLMLTKDGVTFFNTSYNVLLSFIVFLTIYTAIFIVFLYAMIKAIKKGPKITGGVGYDTTPSGQVGTATAFSKTDERI
jgi:cytochrome d ubiquinol oxidase subunit I